MQTVAENSKFTHILSLDIITIYLYYPTDTQGVESEKGLPGEGPWNQGTGRAADVMRLAFIMLLGGAAINNFSFDVTPAANALIWVALGLFVLWALIAMFTPARWVPALMGFLTYPIVIALYSISFQLAQ
jgi:hypothetical protein